MTYSVLKVPLNPNQPTNLAENTGHKKVTKNRHLGPIAQLCRAISSSQLRYVSTIGKNLLSSNMSSTCPHNMVNLRLNSGWDRFIILGHPSKFEWVSHLGSVTARHLVVGVSQTLQRWTEGAIFVRQGDHHVGHWPTFLVVDGFLWNFEKWFPASNGSGSEFFCWWLFVYK